jgi:hypothetical protein
LAVVADLERRFPLLEDNSTRTRVGIGVATGADAVFITKDARIVERSRLLPLVTASDIASGELRWSGKYLINPWESGELINPVDYPRFNDFLEANSARLLARHVAVKQPSTWYRTIDRVDPSLIGQPKLLLPDLKASSQPVLEGGGLYPHHNLYFVVSAGWDLEVLCGLLLSDLANLFVGAYCVMMRGGCYRFQAQYLRRMRVPHPSGLSRDSRQELARSFRLRDVEAATAAAKKVYGLSSVPRPNSRENRAG